MTFTTTLLTASVVLRNDIKMFIYFSKHLGYLGMNLVLTSLEYNVGKIRGRCNLHG